MRLYSTRSLAFSRRAGLGSLAHPSRMPFVNHMEAEKKAALKLAPFSVNNGYRDRA